MADDEPRDEQPETRSEDAGGRGAARPRPPRSRTPRRPRPKSSRGGRGRRSRRPRTPEERAGEPRPPRSRPEADAEEPKPARVGRSGQGLQERGLRGEDPPGAELEPIKIEPQRELSAEERARLEAEAEERARAEAEATAEAGEEPVPAREPAVELASEARIQATGKRKSSIARVVLRAGSGNFEINQPGLEEYFPRHQHQTFVRQPLVTSGYEGKVDVRVRVHGGGIAGQAGAVRHGIARALTEIDPELRGELKRRGLLTRDARAKERRKAGLKKARKRPQFSKR